jgi:chromosome segregation ATPase
MMTVQIASPDETNGLIGQGQCAEIARMSPADLTQALIDAGVPPFQETLDEVQESLLRG